MGHSSCQKTQVIKDRIDFKAESRNPNNNFFLPFEVW